MSETCKSTDLLHRARRLVTGIDKSGLSFAELYDYTPSFIDYGRAASSEIWVDEGGAPALQPDLVGETQRLAPPIGGSVCRVFTMRPEGSVVAEDSEAKKFDTGDSMEQSAITGPRWHTTLTIDYCFVLSGQVELLLDDGVHLLFAGSVVVQRGTRHAWRNPGPDDCQIAFVLIDRGTVTEEAAASE